MKSSSTHPSSSSIGVVIVNEGSVAERKRELFVKVLKQEFIREIQYLWDVANDRAQARDTFTSKIVAQLQSASSLVPIATVSAVVEKLGSVAEFAADHVRDKRTETIANLVDELDLNRLEILIDVVAREALRRYEVFIVERLSDSHDEGVIPFAKIGARRMIEKLSRSGKQLGKGIGIALNESTLLAGLIEGRSGSFIDGWSNHTVTLKAKEKNLLGKEKAKEMDIEDVYARPGMRRFEVQSDQLIDEVYARRKAWHQEQPGWEKFAGLMKDKTDAFYNFGYVRFRKKEKNDPKAGYILMPMGVIKSRYDFQQQNKNELSAPLRAELNGSAHSIIEIDRKTIEAYLSWNAQDSVGSLLNYVRKLLRYPLIQQVCYHGDLTGLTLKGRDFSHCDFSGATFSGDLSGTNFSHSYLIAAHFEGVTSAKEAIFVDTQAAFLNADGIDFSGADLAQANFSYASLKGARFDRCRTIGTVLIHADMTQVTDKSLVLERESQTEASIRRNEEEREELLSLHAEMNDRLDTFERMQAELSQHYSEALVDGLQALDDKIQSSFAEKQTSISNNVNKEIEKAKTEMRAIIQSELAAIKKDSIKPEELYAKLEQKLIAEMQKAGVAHAVENKEIQEAIVQSRTITQQNSDALMQLQNQIQKIVDQQAARISFEKYCKDELAELNRRLLNTADKGQVQQLQSELKKLQSELSQIKSTKSVEEQLSEFKETIESRFKHLDKEMESLRAALPDIENRLQTELASQLNRQNQRIDSLQQNMAEFATCMKARIEQLEQRVDKLEDVTTELQNKLSRLTVNDEKVNQQIDGLKKSLAQALTQQQDQRLQHEQLLKRLQVMQDATQKSADASAILGLQREMGLIQANLNETVNAKPHLNLIHQLGAQLSELQSACKTEEKVSKDKLYELQSWFTEHSEYLSLWQNNILQQSEKTHREQQQALAKLKDQLDERMQQFEARLDKIEGMVKESCSLKFENEELQKKYEQLQDELKANVQENKKTAALQLEQQRKMVELQRASQKTANLTQLKEIQSEVEKLSTQLKSASIVVPKELQTIQEELKQQRENYVNTAKMFQGKIEIIAGIQADIEKIDKQAQQINALHQALLQQQEQERHTEERINTTLSRMHDGLTTRISQLESRVSGLEDIVSRLQFSVQLADQKQDSATQQMLSLKNQLSELVKQRTEDERKQDVYRKQIVQLRTQIQAADTSAEVNLLKEELEAVKKKLEQTAMQPNNDAIDQRFAEIIKQNAGMKSTLESLIKKNASRDSQLQIAFDNIQSVENTLKTTQSEWDTRWSNYVEAQKQEQHNLKTSCEEAFKACEQRLNVLEGRVTVLEEFVQDLRQGFAAMKVEKNEISQRLNDLEGSIKALLAKDKNIEKTQTSYLSELETLEKQLAAAQSANKLDLAQEIKAKIEALHQQTEKQRSTLSEQGVMNHLKKLQQDYDAMRKELTTSSKSQAKTRAEINALDEQCTNNEKRIEELQVQFQNVVAVRNEQNEKAMQAIQNSINDLIGRQPEQTVVKKLQALRQAVLDDKEHHQSLALYIPAHGQLEMGEGVSSQSLEDWVSTELMSANVTAGVIVGDAASGKTLFFRQMERKLWQDPALSQLQPGGTIPKATIPIYIPLGQAHVSPENLWSYLENVTDYNIRFNKAEIEVLRDHYHVLLLADGYENIHGRTHDLIKENSLANTSGRVKMLLGCRLERFLSLDETRLFSQARIRFMSQFTEEQVMLYIERYLEMLKATHQQSKINWTKAQYESYLQGNPELKDLLTQPALLRIALDVLPTLSTQLHTQLVSTTKGVLDHFVNHWFKEQADKLESSGQLPDRGDIQKRIRRFCKDFAEGLKRSNISAVHFPFADDIDDDASFSPDPTRPNSPNGEWVVKLFGDEKNQPVRTASPLKTRRHNKHQIEYQFAHPKLKDYFTTVAGVTPVSATEQPRLIVTVTPPQVEEKHPVVSMPASTIISPVTTVQTVKPSESIDFSAIHQMLTHEQIRFFADLVMESKDYESEMISYILKSRGNPQAGKAAANAITILNAAGVNLSKYNFSDVHIPGADLSGAWLENTQFTGAHLENVNFQNAWLRGTNFSSSHMTKVQLDEYPEIRFNQAVVQALYSQNGKWLVAASADELFVYHTKDYQLATQWTAHANVVNQFTFGMNGEQIVSVGADHKIGIWMTATGQAVYAFTQHSPITIMPDADPYDLDVLEQKQLDLLVTQTVNLHPTTHKITVGGLDGDIYQFSPDEKKSDKLLESKATKLGAKQIQGLAWNSKGNLLAAGRISREAVLWNAETKQTTVLSGHSGAVNVVAFTPDGKELVTGGSDKMIHVWNLQNNKLERKLEGLRGGVNGFAFDQNGERLATASDDKAVTIWDYRSGQVLKQYSGHSEAVKSVSYRPDNKQLASASDDKSIHLWKVSTKPELHQTKGHRRDIQSIVRDDKLGVVYSSSEDGSIREWRNGKQHRVFTTQKTSVTSLALDTKRQRLYSTHWDKSIKVWDTQTVQMIKEFKGLSTLVNHLALDANGSRFAWGGTDGKVRLCEAETGKIMKEFKGPTGGVNQLSFVDHDASLVAATEDNDLFLWDIASGALTNLSGHEQSVISFVYYPENNHLLSASYDYQLRLWDLSNPDASVRQYEGHTSPMSAVAKDPTGKFFVSSSDDQVLYLWDIENEKPLTKVAIPFAAKSIVWHQENGRDAILVGSGPQLLNFSVKQNSGQFVLELLWKSGIPSLFVVGANIAGAKGLSASQTKFFHQRGAMSTMDESIDNAFKQEKDLLTGNSQSFTLRGSKKF